MQSVIIRQADISDIDTVTELEKSCFPVSEAADRKAFELRLRNYPECFRLLEIDGKVISMINGMTTNENDLCDEMYSGTDNRTKLVWEEKSDSVASITKDGVITAKGDGTTTLNGYIVPIDTEAILYENGTSNPVDNYVYKPSAVVIPISANVTVGDGSPEQTGNIATDEEILSWAAADYMTKNSKTVSVKTLNVSDEGKYEITLYDENDEVLDKYVINPKTGVGVNSANEVINLPQTGMNTAVEMLIVIISMLMIGIGLIVVMYSRKKHDEESILKNDLYSD